MLYDPSLTFHRLSAPTSASSSSSDSGNEDEEKVEKLN